jgi:hypothetical protein
LAFARNHREIGWTVTKKELEQIIEPSTMERKLSPTPSPLKLAEVVAREYPATEILVSFPDQWELVQQLNQGDHSLYVAKLPPSQEQVRSNHFLGLSPEINRAITEYRMYILFQPWPQPLLHVAWDQAKGEGQVLGEAGLRVQLQPVGEAQVWRGETQAILWECYLYEARQQQPTWLEKLTQFWRIVEADIGVQRVFTQPHDPSFEEEVYTDFLSRLGYAPDPELERWWSRSA